MPLSRLTSVCSRIAPARRFWFALLVVCAGLGCDRLLTDPLRYGTVDVSVTLASGEPVEGALLTLYTGPRPVQYAQSGRDGTFRFTEVPFGVYGVTIVRPARYALLETLVGGRSTSFIDNLTVNGDPIAPLRFTLQVRTAVCGGSIRVRVRDVSGAPVPGATLWLYTNLGDYRSTLTGADGAVTFDQLLCSAEYGVKVVPPPGYSVTTGPGSSYFDGIKSSALTDVVFTLSQP